VAQEGSTNNTASFDAENAESVQESGNIYVVSAISAYVMNPNLWVLHRHVGDCFQDAPRTDWMSETMEQRVGHNPFLTSWRDLIRILSSFRWFHIVVVVLIVYYKKEDHRGSN
jgi:hypothetical protein